MIDINTVRNGDFVVLLVPVTGKRISASAETVLVNVATSPGVAPTALRIDAKLIDEVRPTHAKGDPVIDQRLEENVVVAMGPDELGHYIVKRAAGRGYHVSNGADLVRPPEWANPA
jgi:hypothetical protein